MASQENRLCSQCGAPIDVNASACKFCGATNSEPPRAPQPTYAPPPSPVYTPPPTSAANLSSKSRVTAGILGILLGSFGAHKFYLGQTGLGILYLVFCWAYIPGIIGLVEGIIYLSCTDQVFYEKYVKK